MLDLFRAFEIFVLDAAIKRALVALWFASAQVRLADARMHHFASCGDLEPLGGRFVSLDFRHGNISKVISDFWILDCKLNHGASDPIQKSKILNLQ